MADKIATREAYGSALAEFGDKYDFVVMDADLSKSTKTDTFKKKFPERFINMGIAEANMITTAAGIASCGKTVFASSFAMFASGRAFEQVRNSVAYPHLNVKIGATHAGISVGEDGATHQCLEDIALMRALPGMVVISPADAIEARAAVLAAIEHDGPVYLRFGRLSVPVYNDPATYKFELGKGIVLSEGSDVTIIANGLLVPEAVNAAEMLKADGIRAEVINIHTIKPIDAELITKSVSKTGAVVTCEEHNIIGGLGSAVAEVLCENCPAPMERIGAKDKFGKSGKPAALLKMYEMTADDIAAAAKRAIKKKTK
ncbi:MAG: transketolase family protein [Clostridia bacterium]|nr:transketolase family protein [Clostridia bacterium]